MYVDDVRRREDVRCHGAVDVISIPVVIKDEKHGGQLSQYDKMCVSLSPGSRRVHGTSVVLVQSSKSCVDKSIVIRRAPLSSTTVM